MTITNGNGETHGLVVTEQRAVISGGTSSSSMTLDDNGARFSNSSTGAPVTVTGIADGRSDFDAVNFRQLETVRKDSFAGIAGVAAMANIPDPRPGKNHAIGVGFGNYKGQQALALGLSMADGQKSMKISAALNSRDEVVFGVGFGVSW